MKTFQRAFLIAIVILTILSLLLSACGPLDILNNGKDRGSGNNRNNNGNDNGDQGENSNAKQVTLCHKTGNAEDPYVLITVSENGASHGHSKHAGDIIPAPDDGCPATSKGQDSDQESDEGSTANKVAICHKTGSAENPYVLISVSENAVKHGHGKHEGDIIPAPEGGCPDR